MFLQNYVHKPTTRRSFVSGQIYQKQQQQTKKSYNKYKRTMLELFSFQSQILKFIYLFIFYLFIYLFFIYSFIYLFTYLFIYLFIYLF